MNLHECTFTALMSLRDTVPPLGNCIAAIFLTGACLTFTLHNHK